jgi:hypothetical protein
VKLNASASNAEAKNERNIHTFAMSLPGKIKVKVTLEQDTKAQRWSRGIPVLFL